MPGIEGNIPGPDQASFAAEPGEVHALVGENGAGKSTMIKILSGLLRLDAGRVRVHGNDVVLESPQAALRLGIGTIFQVRENRLRTITTGPLNTRVTTRPVDGRVWHLDVGSSHPGAGVGPKGWAVRPLKRYAPTPQPASYTTLSLSAAGASSGPD